ncbi:MAG: hypothetical protein J7L71_11390, partial [Spirochaetaceae bacterium]|nr:hypothetical protein [Spirochaetaceae bacterium]
MSFGSIKQIKLRLLRQWEKGRFLQAIALGESLFPFEAAIKGPTAAEMVIDFDAVRVWIKDIQTGCEKSRLQLVWKEINHRQLGRNAIPVKIIFYDIVELTGFLGKKTELKAFENGLAVLGNIFPDLIDWAAQYPFE